MPEEPVMQREFLPIEMPEVLRKIDALADQIRETANGHDVSFLILAVGPIESNGEQKTIVRSEVESGYHLKAINLLFGNFIRHFARKYKEELDAH